MKFSRNYVIAALTLIALWLLFRPRTSNFWNPFKNVKVCKGVCDACVLDADYSLQCSGSKPYKKWCLGPQYESGRHSMCCPCK